MFLHRPGMKYLRTSRSRAVRPGIGGEAGQALVEAALTMLMFLVFLFAILEGGRIIQVQQTLTNAARLGARRSVAPLTQTGTLATVGDVQGVVQAFLQSASVDPGSATIGVNQAVVISGNQFTRVTVTFPYSVMTMAMFGQLNVTLTGRSLMRNETSP